MEKCFERPHNRSSCQNAYNINWHAQQLTLTCIFYNIFRTLHFGAGIPSLSYLHEHFGAGMGLCSIDSVKSGQRCLRFNFFRRSLDSLAGSNISQRGVSEREAATQGCGVDGFTATPTPTLTPTFKNQLRLRLRAELSTPTDSNSRLRLRRPSRAAESTYFR